MPNIQSIAAITIVALTIFLFAWRILRKNKNSGSCGGGCSCEVKDLAKKK